MVRLVLVAFVVCVAAAQPASAQEQPGSQGQPRWLRYERAAEFDAVVENDMEVPLRDGGHLSCDLYRPGRDGSVATGRFPGVVNQYHAYSNDRHTEDPPNGVFLAERGYAVLQCNVRGTGGSPGELEVFSAREARDNYDIIEWLAAQEWSTGKVGQTGFSYGGITAYRAAAERPPHLVTIVPHAAYASPYHDISYLGGMRGADIRVWLLGFLTAQNSNGTPPEQQARLPERQVAIDREWGEHPTFDSFWRERAVDHAAIRKAGIPVLGFGGWYDLYQRGMPANHEALGDLHWLVMGPNTHFDSPFFRQVDGGILAWFDHWLMGLDDAPLPQARVTSWEMPRGEGRWTGLRDWPPRTTPVVLRMRTDGALARRAGPEGTVDYVVDPTDGMPNFWNIPAPDTSPIPEYQAVREQGRASFTSPPLGRDVVVAGSVTMDLEAALTATDGNLVARVLDVAPDGRAALVGTGYLRASHRHSHRRPTPVDANEPTKFVIDVWPSHWRFAAGHQLRVSVSSGDVPRIHPDAPPGTVSVGTGKGGSSSRFPC